MLTLKCRCGDRTHDTFGTTAWHRAYCNWYDARKAGRRRRASVWGVVADALARFA